MVPAPQPGRPGANESRVAAAAPQLSPLELHAVMLVGKEAAKTRDVLAAGLGQRVDFFLHLSGHVDVAERSMARTTKSPSVEDVLRVVFATLGEKTRDKVYRALTIALSRNAPAPPASTAIMELAKMAIAEMKLVDQIEKKGAVSGQIVLDVPGKF